MDDEFEEHDRDCPLYGTGLGPTTILGPTLPAVAGSRMRHGGPFTTDSGLTVGTDEWRQMRCMCCGAESMTPIEMIPFGVDQDPDGAYRGLCGSCAFDISSGYRPGHNPNRRRRRRR